MNNNQPSNREKINRIHKFITEELGAKVKIVHSAPLAIDLEGIEQYEQGVIPVNNAFSETTIQSLVSICMLMKARFCIGASTDSTLPDDVVSNPVFQIWYQDDNDRRRRML